MSSPRYHPQKETFCWAKENSFFMQKMTDRQSGIFLGNLFPNPNKMFPQILESPKRFSRFPRPGRRPDSIGAVQWSTLTIRSGRQAGDGSARSIAAPPQRTMVRGIARRA